MFNQSISENFCEFDSAQSEGANWWPTGGATNASDRHALKDDKFQSHHKLKHAVLTVLEALQAMDVSFRVDIPKNNADHSFAII